MVAGTLITTNAALCFGHNFEVEILIKQIKK